MSRNRNPLENLALIGYIGVAMIVPIMAGVYAGTWIDKQLNTKPIFLFILIILGVITGFLNLYKFAVKQAGHRQRK